MRKIVMVNGEVFSLADKNKEIFEKLQPVLDIQLKKKEQNMYLKKPFQLKFGAVINNKLLELFRSYGLMDDGDIETLDADDLKDFYLHFMELVNEISESIEITDVMPMTTPSMVSRARVLLRKSATMAILRRLIRLINQ